MHNRANVHDLTEALCAGATQGSAGRLDVSGVSTQQLDAAIAQAQRLGCSTDEARLLLTTARLVRRLREALATNNHARLAKVLGDAQGVAVSDMVAAEFALAHEELDNRTILAALSSALSAGMSTGAVGHLNVSTIELTPLRDALALAKRLGADTPEAKQMVRTARVVLRLRTALLRGDYQMAHDALERVRKRRTVLAAVAMHEVRDAGDEVDNWLVTTGLTKALVAGRASGSPGQLDTSTVDVVALRRGLAHAAEVGIKTPDAAALVTAAKQILGLRIALVDAAWDDIPAILEASQQHIMSDTVLEELQMAQDACDNRTIFATLRSALQQGGPEGRVGYLTTDTVDLRALDSAIATVMDIGCVTEEAEQLLATAKFVRRLRSVLVSGNWDWVEQVLSEAHGRSEEAAATDAGAGAGAGAGADGEGKGDDAGESSSALVVVAKRGVSGIPRWIHEAAADEVGLIMREVNTRRSMSQLTLALGTGQVTGKVGRIQKEAIETEQLGEAIAFTDRVGTHTSDAKALLDAARLVLDLRRALLADDLPRAHGIVERVDAEGGGVKSVADAARVEMSVITKEVQNYTVEQGLLKSFKRGMATGRLGELDVSSISTDDLDEAIATATKLGAGTKHAKQCLLTAMVIRRLRESLAKRDWEFVRTVLSEAEDERENIIEAARPELHAAQQEVTRGRRVMRCSCTYKFNHSPTATGCLPRRCVLAEGRHAGA